MPIQILFAYGMRFAGYPRARRDFSRLRVRAALRAAWERLEALRRLEDFRAWDDNARCEAPLCPSFLKAPRLRVSAFSMAAGVSALTGAFLFRGWCTFGRRWKIHARLPSFREPDGNCLFWVAYAVLPLSHVMDLFAHELTRLGAWRFTLACVLARPF